MSVSGRLIVFEGPEGAGKSTQLYRTAVWLRERGLVVREVREPGTSPVGQEIRNLLLDPAQDIAPVAEALLFMAARAQLVRDELRPALAAGETILADRFFLSTYAYQIAGRGLPEAEVIAANAFATDRLVPDLTVLLRLPSAVGMARAHRRGGADRMERAGDEFHERVSAAFARCSEPAWQARHPECGLVAAVDGAPDQETVFAAVRQAVAERWPELGAGAAR